MTEKRLQYLFGRYIHNELEEEEEREFMDMVPQCQHRSVLLALLYDHIRDTPAVVSPSDAPEKKLMEFLRAERASESRPAGMRRWLIPVAAAGIILILLAGVFFTHRSKRPVPVDPIAVADVPAGRTGAVLTLGNGRVIVLDSAGNGDLAGQGNTTIRKSGDVVSYVPSGSSDLPVEYNTMSTPKGRQISLVLADGSKVWLNAASSIRFPASFSGGLRKVEVTGEVYFEVAHTTDPHGKKKIPFIVAANGATVEVLGTHFNVNAYTDEPYITTTLLEGAVNFRKGDKEVKLLPGQQSVLAKDGQLTVNTHINTEEIMAWRDGYFHFESTPLTAVLRQFSRWYDADIVFEGQVPQDRFFAIVKRSNSLSTVLKALQTTNVHFSIEEGTNNATGRKIIIKQH